MLRVLLLASLFAFTACDTVQTAPQRGGETIDTGSMRPVPSGRGSHEDSGLVLAYDFVTPNGAKLSEDGMCRLRLIETNARKSYFMQIDRSKSASFVALPAGHYETVRMGCGITKTWDVGNLFKGGFQVENGSVSYAGKVSFVFKDNQLQVVERASRSQHAAGFAAASAVVPNGLRIVSAYNLEPLTEDMAEAGMASNGFDVHAQGIASQPVLEGLLGQLRQCEPKSKDPLQFGRLDYTASYKDGHFSGFPSRTDKNAFNADFRGCVSDTLMSFKAPSGDVAIHVVY